MAVALYAGPFDPVHLGHLDVIEQSARSYDEVVVAVVANPQKSAGLFTPEQRLSLVTDAVEHLATVKVVHFYGLTTELARQEAASVLVRAVHKERANEFSMAATNALVAGIPTVFVPASPATRSISSSLIRELISAGALDAAAELVPPNVADPLAVVVASRVEGSEQSPAE